MTSTGTARPMSRSSAPQKEAGTSRATAPPCSYGVRAEICRCPATTTATARPTSRSSARRPVVHPATGRVLQIWGQAGDIPVPGDYDGNGTTDIAVFRSGQWYIQGHGPASSLGPAGDIPVPGDYDGNGTTDIAVFRSGQWYIQGHSPVLQIWGQAGDIPVPGDYDGNGTTDIAVFRSGQWYIQGNSTVPADLGPGRRRPRPRRLRRQRHDRHRGLPKRPVVHPGPQPGPADLGDELRHPAAASLRATHAHPARRVCGRINARRPYR